MDADRYKSSVDVIVRELALLESDVKALLNADDLPLVVRGQLRDAILSIGAARTRLRISASVMEEEARRGNAS